MENEKPIDLGFLEPGVITPGVVVAMNISFLLLEVVLLMLGLFTNEFAIYFLLFTNLILWFTLNLIIVKMSNNKSIKIE